MCSQESSFSPKTESESCVLRITIPKSFCQNWNSLNNTARHKARHNGAWAVQQSTVMFLVRTGQCRDTATGNPLIWSSWPSWATCLGRCLTPCVCEVCPGNQRGVSALIDISGYVHVEQMEAMTTYPGGHRAYWCMHVTGHYAGEPPSDSETFSDTSDAESLWRTWLRQLRWGPAQSSGNPEFFERKVFLPVWWHKLEGWLSGVFFAKEKKDVRLWEQRNSESIWDRTAGFLFEMCMVGRLVSLPGATWSTCSVGGGATQTTPPCARRGLPWDTPAASPTVSGGRGWPMSDGCFMKLLSPEHHWHVRMACAGAYSC